MSFIVSVTFSPVAAFSGLLSTHHPGAILELHFRSRKLEWTQYDPGHNPSAQHMAKFMHKKLSHLFQPNFLTFAVERSLINSQDLGRFD